MKKTTIAITAMSMALSSTAAMADQTPVSTDKQISMKQLASSAFQVNTMAAQETKVGHKVCFHLEKEGSIQKLV